MRTQRTSQISSAPRSAIEAGSLYHARRARHAVDHPLLRGYAPGLSARIVEDVRTRIERLRHFPKSGKRIDVGDLRQVLSRRYRFKIAYQVTEEEIEIVGIFRFQNREG
jgi:plasmid stabilization system protein ParE